MVRSDIYYPWNRYLRHSPAEIVGLNPTEAMDVFLNVVCCQVEVSTSGWSLVRREPTELGVSEVCDREAPSGEWGRSAAGVTKTSSHLAEKLKRYKRG